MSSAKSKKQNVQQVYVAGSKQLLPILMALALFTISCQKNSSSGPATVDKSFYTVTGSGMAGSAEILMSPYDSTEGRIFVLDQKGSIKKEKSIPPKVENFQRWTINGNTRYTYFHSSGTDLYLDGLQGDEIGYVDICDSNLNVLNTVKLLSHGSINVNVQDKLDAHEFILLGDNHYIYDTYYEATPDNIPDSLHPGKNVKVVNCIIQEVDNGEVVFQWEGVQHPEFYGQSVENNDFTDTTTLHDFMHLNSICVDPVDNNLIVSFRNLDQVVKINRQSGDIMWRLGGKDSDFPLSDDQIFLRQHYPRVIENGQTLIMVDNGLLGVRPYSRILEFQLNEQTKTVSKFSAFKIPDSFIQFTGSVVKEGDTYFIGGGTGNYGLEINYITGSVLMRLNLFTLSYRIIKYNL